MRGWSAWCGALAMSLAACSGGGGGGDGDGPSTPFQFRSSESASLFVTVTRDGQPLQGASVSVVDCLTHETLDARPGSGTAWFVGGTDANGICEAVVSIPTRFEHVDLIVNHHASQGPYTDGDLRAHWGTFAPSSRQRVRIVDLASVPVALEAR